MIRQGERGPVKIGVAKDAARRLINMQTGNHERLILLRTFHGGKVEERKLHDLFADHRISGEWFSFTRGMLGDVGLKEIVKAKAAEPSALTMVQSVSLASEIDELAARWASWRGRPISEMEKALRSGRPKAPP